MVSTDRFSAMETYKQPEIQPDSPVYIHCSRRCKERSTDAEFLQIRLVNRTDQGIRTVVLQIEGLSEYGVVLYTMRDMILAECDAKPHSAFGEDKILALEHTPIHRVRITVEKVVFEDGTLWRRNQAQALISAQEAGWNTCVCGMRNPPQAQYCELCGNAITQKTENLPPTSQEEDFPEIRVPYIETEPPEEYSGMEPQEPPVQNFYTVYEAAPAQPETVPEEHGLPTGLVVLLCILGVIALFAVTAFLAYCFMQYLGKI